MNKDLIKVTKLASVKLRDIIKNHKSEALLFYLKSGGCNGFEYQLKPISSIKNKSNLYTQGDLHIEICNKSLMFVIGTTIDWRKDFIGEGFHFNNPLARNSCGCGSSFNPMQNVKS